MAGSFTDLRIWQKAHELTLKIYLLTKSFPREEAYGLTNQLRRAAVSVEANIAESHGRHHIPDVIKFLIDARASVLEAQSELMVARDVGYCTKKQASALIDEYSELAKQINSLINYKRKSKTKI